MELDSERSQTIHYQKKVEEGPLSGHSLCLFLSELRLRGGSRGK